MMRIVSVYKISILLVVPVFIGCMLREDVPLHKGMSAILWDDVNALREFVGDDVNAMFAPYEYCGYSLSRPAVMWALWHGATNCVAWLLESGADICMKDSEGSTALMMCSNISDDAVCNWADRVYEMGQFNIDEQNNFGRTALSFALARNNSAFAIWCLRHKANVGLRAHYIGTSILPISFMGLRSKSWEVFSMVVKSESFDVTATSSKGEGPLLVLMPDADDYELRFKILIDKGADVNTRSRNGNILCQNMSILNRDCSDRIKFLCNYPFSKENLKDALVYAKVNNYQQCITILEKCIGE